jgi:hypothetical protein
MEGTWVQAPASIDSRRILIEESENRLHPLTKAAPHRGLQSLRRRETLTRHVQTGLSRFQPIPPLLQLP